MGVLVGAVAGYGVAGLIGFIAEAIIRPKYPDMLLGLYLLLFGVCVPLFAIVFGVLFRRLGVRFSRK